MLSAYIKASFRRLVLPRMHALPTKMAHTHTHIHAHEGHDSRGSDQIPISCIQQIRVIAFQPRLMQYNNATKLSDARRRESHEDMTGLLEVAWHSLL